MQPAAASAPADSQTPDYIDELETLNEMRAKGVLTDEEFTTKKQQIFGT